MIVGKILGIRLRLNGFSCCWGNLVVGILPQILLLFAIVLLTNSPLGWPGVWAQGGGSGLLPFGGVASFRPWNMIREWRPPLLL